MLTARRIALTVADACRPALRTGALQQGIEALRWLGFQAFGLTPSVESLSKR